MDRPIVKAPKSSTTIPSPHFQKQGRSKRNIARNVNYAEYNFSDERPACKCSEPTLESIVVNLVTHDTHKCVISAVY